MSAASNAAALAEVLRRGRYLPNCDEVAISCEAQRAYIQWLDSFRGVELDLLAPGFSRDEVLAKVGRLRDEVDRLESRVHARDKEIERWKVRLDDAGKREDELQAHIEKQNAVIGRLVVAQGDA